MTSMVYYLHHYATRITGGPETITSAIWFSFCIKLESWHKVALPTIRMLSIFSTTFPQSPGSRSVFLLMLLGGQKTLPYCLMPLTSPWPSSSQMPDVLEHLPHPPQTKKKTWPSHKKSQNRNLPQLHLVAKPGCCVQSSVEPVVFFDQHRGFDQRKAWKSFNTDNRASSTKNGRFLETHWKPMGSLGRTQRFKVESKWGKKTQILSSPT